MTALSAFTWCSKPATPGRATARARARSSALAYATHTVEDARADETCIAGRADGPASFWGASEQAVMSSSTATESTGVRFTTHLPEKAQRLCGRPAFVVVRTLGLAEPSAPET